MFVDPITPTVPELPYRAAWTGVCRPYNPNCHRVTWQSSGNWCLSTLSTQLSPSYLTEQREPVFVDPITPTVPELPDRAAGTGVCQPYHPNCPRVTLQSSVNRCLSTLSPQLSPSYLTEQREPVFVDPITPTVPELPDRAVGTGVCQPYQPNCHRVTRQSSGNRCLSTLSPQLSPSYLTEQREPVFVDPITLTVPELPYRAAWTGVCRPYNPNCPRVTWQSSVNRCLSTLSPQLSPSYQTEQREPVFVDPITPTVPELPDRAAWTGVCQPYHPNCHRVTLQSSVNRCLSTISPQLSPSYLTEQREPVFVNHITPTVTELPDRAAWTGVCQPYHPNCHRVTWQSSVNRCLSTISPQLSPSYLTEQREPVFVDPITPTVPELPDRAAWTGVCRPYHPNCPRVTWECSVNRCLSALQPQLSPSYLTEQREPVFVSPITPTVTELPDRAARTGVCQPYHPNCHRVTWQSSGNRSLSTLSTQLSPSYQTEQREPVFVNPITPTVPELPYRAAWTGVCRPYNPNCPRVTWQSSVNRCLSTLSPQLSPSYLTEQREPVFVDPITPTVPELPDRAAWTGICRPYNPNCPRVTWQGSVNRCLSTLSPQLSPSYVTEQREPVFVDPITPTVPELPYRAACTGVCRPYNPNCSRVTWQSSVNRCLSTLSYQVSPCYLREQREPVFVGPTPPTVPELPDRAAWTGVCRPYHPNCPRVTWQCSVNRCLSNLSPQLSPSYLTEQREPVFVESITPTVPELPDRAAWTGVCRPYHPNCPRVTWQSSVNRCLSTLSPQLSPIYLTEQREPVFVNPITPTVPELPDRAARTGVCRPYHPNCPRVTWQSSVNRCLSTLSPQLSPSYVTEQREPVFVESITPTVPELPDSAAWTGVCRIYNPNCPRVTWQSSVYRCLSTLSPQLSPSYLTEQREPVFVDPTTRTVPELPDRAAWTGVCRPYHPNCPQVTWQSSVNRCLSNLSPQLSLSYLTVQREPVFVESITPTVPELPDRAACTGVCRPYHPNCPRVTWQSSVNQCLSTLPPELSPSYLTEQREPVFVDAITPSVPELPDRAAWTGVCQPYHPNCPRVTWQSSVNRCLSTLSPQLSPSYLTEQREPVFVNPITPTVPELPDRAARTGVCRPYHPNCPRVTWQSSVNRCLSALPPQLSPNYLTEQREPVFVGRRTPTRPGVLEIEIEAVELSLAQEVNTRRDEGRSRGPAC